MPRVSPVFKVTLPMSQNRNKNSRTRNPSVQTQSNTVNLCFESSREFDTESILLSWFLLTPGDRIYIYITLWIIIYIYINILPHPTIELAELWRLENFRTSCTRALSHAFGSACRQWTDVRCELMGGSIDIVWDVAPCSSDFDPYLFCQHFQVWCWLI